MLNSIFVFLGIILMVYSAIVCFRFIDKINSIDLKNSWNLMLILIIFFLCGYILFFASSILELFTLHLTDLLISSILFLGSIFVVIVLKINIRLIERMHDKHINLETEKTNLAEKINTHSEINEKLTNRVAELEKKLENTNSLLEEFYTYRLRMEKDIRSNGLKKDNAKIKKKINRMKG